MGRAGKDPGRAQAKYRRSTSSCAVEQILSRDRGAEIVDCGSGNAYLTFAAYHYLAHVREVPARVTGVDSNPEVVARSQQRSESLGWPELGFHVGRIADFAPARPPDIVISLHACDTATDEAIALGVKSGSQVILAAPCCQHELFDQLEAPLFQPVLRHGVLRGRMADLLTDAFRALALRIMGYRTDEVQIVSPEHTTKNQKIRAVRANKPVPPQLVQEYRALRDFWQVRPSIETLLGEGFAARLASGAAAS
jgi:SAM-dependent methyltransferase